MDREAADKHARRAEALAPTLVGLSVAEAQERVDEQGGLWIRFAAEDQPVTADFGFGRITATTRDGTVVSAAPG